MQFWNTFAQKHPAAAQWVREGGLFVVVSNLITCIVNSINCIWMAVAGLFVPAFIYNIGTVVLNGGISMVIFFFVNKIIFPEGEKGACA